jgi:hypothetical protein
VECCYKIQSQISWAGGRGKKGERERKRDTHRDLERREKKEETDNKTDHLKQENLPFKTVKTKSK